jgi:hypothetical protein
MAADITGASSHKDVHSKSTFRLLAIESFLSAMMRLIILQMV